LPESIAHKSDNMLEVSILMFAILAMLLNLYSFIILGRVLLSWFPDVDRSNPIVQFLHDTTEPVLQPVRQAMPQMGGFDFSPIVVLIGISVLSRIMLSI
jgi:YggT family protein